MPRGRKRKHDPSIPAHIDQAKLPAGVYWDKSGRGRWYVIEQVEGRPKRRTIASSNARLSELHRLVEESAGVDRDSLAYVLEQFHKSDTFRQLAKKTRTNYEGDQQLAIAYPTKAGPLGKLSVHRMTPALWQRIVDAIAAQGTPSKANHLLRYVRRVFRWAVNRDYAKTNPCIGVEQARERKRRRLPTTAAVNKLSAYAQLRGARQAHTKGSCAPYLWIVIELAYLLRLRGIEVATLTDANATPEGVLTNRTKGSRDNVVRWSPRLRAAWDAAVAYRDRVQLERRMPTPLRPEDRQLLVSEQGTPLRKSSIDTAWQRLVRDAIAEGVLTEFERFSPHDLKRKGITDTPGTRGEKQLASGHKTEAMLDVYDQSVPVVNPAGENA